MAIVIAGVIGIGVVAGVITGAANYEDHEDYSDHSDYSDAAERARAREKARKAREEQKEAERKEARTELTSVIRRNVNSFHKKTGIMPGKVVTASECKFKSFKEDMKPMDDSVQESVQNEIGQDDQQHINVLEKQIKQIDKAILAINEKILNTK